MFIIFINYSINVFLFSSSTHIATLGTHFLTELFYDKGQSSTPCEEQTTSVAMTEEKPSLLRDHLAAKKKKLPKMIFNVINSEVRSFD